jgi:chromosome segregation ATPase
VSTDRKAELRDALTLEGPAAALHVLRHAIQWSAAVLAELTGPDALTGLLDDAAMECVVALDDALDEVAVLEAPVAALVDAAVTGEPVAEHLRTRMDALSAFADRVAVARREHEALARVEERLRADAAEHEQLSAGIDELHRYERLSDALPELRAQQQALATRTAAMLAPVEQAERALVDSADAVITLSTDRLADVSDRTKALLAEVAEKERLWAKEVREHDRLATAIEDNARRYEELRQQRTDQLAELAEYCRIDDELMTSLPGGENDVPDGAALRAALASVRQTLRTVDDGLRAALDKHDELLGRDRQLIGLSSRTHGAGSDPLGGGTP